MKQSQEFEVRLTIKCLENISNREEGAEKERIQALIRKLDRREIRDTKALSQQQSQFMSLLMEGFHGYRQALTDLLKLDKYKVVADSNFEGVDFLLNLQPSLNIDKSNLTLDNLFSKYTVHLLKFKKTHETFPKEFSADWTAKAKEKVAENSKRKEAKKQPVKPEKQDSQPQYEESEEEESEVVPQNSRVIQSKGREREPDRGRDRQRQRQLQRERERELERQKERDRQRQLARERQNRKIQPQREIQRGQANREPKNKAIVIQKYLESRKDLHFTSNKIREVSEHLAALMDNFMRDTMSKLSSVAKIKNKKNPRTGNELGYFSQENQRITANIQKAFHIQPNTKIFALNYKHKLEIYTTHRTKEFRKEDELRQALEIKTNENEKRIDKKVETYILKPRPKEAETIVIFRDDKEFPRTNNLSINMEHIIYYLNGHQLLRNSHLMWEIYLN